MPVTPCVPFRLSEVHEVEGKEVDLGVEFGYSAGEVVGPSAVGVHAVDEDVDGRGLPGLLDGVVVQEMLSVGEVALLPEPFLVGGDAGLSLPVLRLVDSPLVGCSFSPWNRL